jgi:tetratricopeptide (TPR) repeat protein
MVPIPAADWESLTPVESGPGILVCEPVARGASLATAAFGAGCGRWLHFWVAGNPELGKTPLWSWMDLVRQELGKPDLRLTRGDLASLPAAAGLTHVALGEIRGSPARCKLRYQLVELSTGRRVGAPLTVNGGEATVTAGLPQVAREIGQRLGVASPRVPPKVAESASELRALGQLPWYPDDSIPDRQVNLLGRLWQRSALAGLFYAINQAEAKHPGPLRGIATGVDRMVRDHPLVMAEVGRGYYRAEAGFFEFAPKAGLRSHPNSYLLVTATVWYHIASGDFPAAIRAAEHGIRCSPRNPQAWSILGTAYSAWAQAVRQGRFAPQLNQEEGPYCQQLYEREAGADLRAVQADPKNATVWRRLSASAAFAGDREVAEEAFWTAVRLAPRDADLLQWGLELYQPKWYGDRAEAAKVAQLAVAAASGPGWGPGDRVAAACSALLADVPQAIPRLLRTPQEQEALAEGVQRLREEGATTAQ